MAGWHDAGDGVVRRCTAPAGRCPYADYPTRGAAMRAVEEKAAEEAERLGSHAPMRKSPRRPLAPAGAAAGSASGAVPAGAPVAPARVAGDGARHTEGLAATLRAGFMRSVAGLRARLGAWRSVAGAVSGALDNSKNVANNDNGSQKGYRTGPATVPADGPTMVPAAGSATVPVAASAVAGGSPSRGPGAGNGRVIGSTRELAAYALRVMDSYDVEFLKRTGDWSTEQMRVFMDSPAEWRHQLALAYQPGYRELDLQVSRASLILLSEGREVPAGDVERATVAKLMRLAYVTRASVPAGVWLRLNDEWEDSWADPDENREQVARDLVRVGIEARVNGLAKRYARGVTDAPFDSILGEAQRGARGVLGARLGRRDPVYEDSPVKHALASMLGGMDREDLEARFPAPAPKPGDDELLHSMTLKAHGLVLDLVDEARARGDWNAFSDRVLVLRRIDGAVDDDDTSPLDLPDDASCLAYAAAVAGGSVRIRRSALPLLIDMQDREEERGYREGNEKNALRKAARLAGQPLTSSGNGNGTARGGHSPDALMIQEARLMMQEHEGYGYSMDALDLDPTGGATGTRGTGPNGTGDAGKPRHGYRPLRFLTDEDADDLRRSKTLQASYLRRGPEIIREARRLKREQEEETRRNKARQTAQLAGAWGTTTGPARQRGTNGTGPTQKPLRKNKRTN